MGIFGDLKKSLAESPGRILLSQLADIQQQMATCPESLRTAILMGFVEKRGRLLGSLGNWSANGRIETGKALQKQGRQTFDMNVTEGFALWLAGAWLESMERPGVEAAKVHDFLSQIPSF